MLYFEDDRDTVYDIEMQNANEKNLPRRARYYQSMIDMEQMEKRVRALTRDTEWRHQYMTLYERDQRNIAKGRKEGHEEGRLEGLEEGRAEGEAIARQKQTKDIILRALKRGVSISEIAVILGMTEDDIREFCAENEITI